MDRHLFVVLGLLVAVSGCVNSSNVRWNLDDIVVSQDEIPDEFELTHQQHANSSEFSKSSILRRVHRRYSKNTTNHTTVVLSSATVYESEEDAVKVKEKFLSRTGIKNSQPENVYYDGKKATKIRDVEYSTLDETLYLYRRNGSLIYFIGIHDSEDPGSLAESLFKIMEQAE